MTAGDPVTVDGMLLPGGCVWIEDISYVRLREVAEALKTELKWREETKTILLDGVPVETVLSAEPVEVSGEIWMPADWLPQLQPCGCASHHPAPGQRTHSWWASSTHSWL